MTADAMVTLSSKNDIVKFLFVTSQMQYHVVYSVYFIFQVTQS